MTELIVQKSERFVRDLFEKEMPEHLTYHDIEHTEYVVNQSRIIGQNSGLTEEEINTVMVAAWFHDSGFVSTSIGHEKKSQELAREFLTSAGVPKDQIKNVILCIKATEMPQDPGNNKLARVLCDADMAYLSEEFYLDKTKRLRKEWNTSSEQKLTREEYYKQTVDLFNNHNYFTEYATRMFSSGKAKNFQSLHKLNKKRGKKGKKSAKPGSGIKSTKNEKLPGRGVESMFRLTARNQINLSSIADNKANILISINSIVLTVLVSIGIGKISDYPVITVPAIVLIITCLSTVIFAILSTRPKISSGKFTEEDIHNKKVNLLFFGNFYNMKPEEYEWALKEMMTDPNYLYSSLIRDQYSLGKVISKKYRLLRIAYTIFMIGLVVSSILFAVFILFVT
jgi:predicted metal-dependent HD superfamily phosphohydrolase